MRKLNWATIILDLVLVALGVFFIIRPEGVESVLCYILAASVALIGITFLVGHFIQRPDAAGQRSGNGFVLGVLLIILAVFIISKQSLIIALVPFLFGVMVFVRGLMIIESLFILRRRGFRIAVPLSSGLLTMALGLFIMLFPFETMKALFILIGCGLIIGGISGIVGEFMIWNFFRQAEHEAERIRDTGRGRGQYPRTGTEPEDSVTDAEASAANAEDSVTGAEDRASNLEVDLLDAGSSPADAEDSPADAGSSPADAGDSGDSMERTE